jgi:hypothetical protein
MCTTPTQKIVEFQNLQVGPNKLLSFKTLKFDLKGNGKWSINNKCNFDKLYENTKHENLCKKWN